MQQHHAEKPLWVWNFQKKGLDGVPRVHVKRKRRIPDDHELFGNPVPPETDPSELKRHAAISFEHYEEYLPSQTPSSDLPAAKAEAEHEKEENVGVSLAPAEQLADKLKKAADNTDMPSSQPQNRWSAFEAELDALSLPQLEHLWSLVHSMALSDGLVHSLATFYIRETLPQRHALLFVKALVLPRVAGLEQPASRTLVGTLTAIGKTQPKALLHALILPLMHDSAMGSAQAEIATRLAKETLSAALQQQLLREHFVELQGQWTEFQLDVVAKILAGLEGTFAEETWQAVLNQLSLQAHGQSASLKFANLLFQLVQKQLVHAPKHFAAVRSVLTKCSHNYMSKAALAKLQAIEKAQQTP